MGQVYTQMKRLKIGVLRSGKKRYMSANLLSVPAIIHTEFGGFVGAVYLPASRGGGMLVVVSLFALRESEYQGLLSPFCLINV